MKPALISLTLSFLCALTASAQISLKQGQAFWDDPDFRQKFMGTYGQLPDVEPVVSREESAFLQGVVPLIRENPRQAIKELNNANSPQATAVYDFAIGNIFFQDGDLTNARAAYKSAIKKYPEFRRVYKNLGLVEVRDGNFSDAIIYLSKSAELGDKDSRTYGLLGYSNLQQEAYIPAESAYRQAILFDPESMDWKLGLAQSLFAQEKYAEGIALFEQLIAENPDRDDFWLLQTNGFLGSKQPMKAAENLEMVSRMGKLDSGSYVLLGDIYLNARMPDLALGAYQTAAGMSKKPDVKTLTRSASIMAQIGATDEATALIDSIQEEYADRLSKSQKVTLLNQEAKIARQKGDTETAGTILAELVEIDPLNGDVILEMAEYEMAQGNMEKAEFYFQRATNLEDYKAQALVAYAKLKVKQGKYNDAVSLLDESLALAASPRIEDYRDRVARAARSLR